MVVATGTASGKSLCYQIPIIDLGARRDPGHRSAAVPHQGAGPRPAAGAAVLAGARAAGRHLRRGHPHRGTGHRPPDTPTWCSPTPRCSTSGILPYHDRWATFLMRLRYVVVDELHTLRGIFGSHVAHVLRRLRRVVRPLRLRARLLLLLAPPSATRPSWPRPLSGLPVDPGRRRRLAPGRARSWPCGTGPCSIPRTGTRPSANAETAGHPGPPGGDRVSARIAFSSLPQGRRAGRPARPPAPELGPRPGWPRRWPPTGAATSPRSAARSSRRWPGATSSACRPPTPWSWASTSPGSTPWSSTASPGRWPPSGSRRAGPAAPSSRPSPCWSRATTSSTAGTCDHPERALHPSARTGGGQPVEPVRRPAPDRVRRATSSRCRRPTSAVLGGDLDDAVRDLVLADALKPRGGRMYWARREARLRPWGSAPDRRWSSASSDAETGRLVGTVDEARVFHVAHPAAIYLHQGRQWRVEHLDLDDHVALLAGRPTPTSTPSPATTPTSPSPPPRASRPVGRLHAAPGRGGRHHHDLGLPAPAPARPAR